MTSRRLPGRIDAGDAVKSVTILKSNGFLKHLSTYKQKSCSDTFLKDRSKWRVVVANVVVVVAASPALSSMTSSSLMSAAAALTGSWDDVVLFLPRPTASDASGLLFVREFDAVWVFGDESVLSSVFERAHVKNMVLAYAPTDEEKASYEGIESLDFAASAASSSSAAASPSAESAHPYEEALQALLKLRYKDAAFEVIQKFPNIRLLIHTGRVFAMDHGARVYIQEIWDEWFTSKLSTDEGKFFVAELLRGLESMEIGNRRRAEMERTLKNLASSSDTIVPNTGLLNAMRLMEKIAKSSNAVSSNESFLKRTADAIFAVVSATHALVRYDRGVFGHGGVPQSAFVGSLAWDEFSVQNAYEALGEGFADVNNFNKKKLKPLFHDEWQTEYDECKKSIKNKRDAYGKYVTDVTRKNKLNEKKEGVFEQDCADYWGTMRDFLVKKGKRMMELRGLAAREWATHLRMAQQVLKKLDAEATTRRIALHDVVCTARRNQYVLAAPVLLRRVVKSSSTKDMRKCAAHHAAYAWGLPVPKTEAFAVTPPTSPPLGIAVFRGVKDSPKSVVEYLRDASKKLVVLDDWWPDSVLAEAEEASASCAVLVKSF